MKSLSWLTESILQDCGIRCDADVTRDVLTVERRVENEGDSFLTITLPAYCSGIERGLATGKLEPSVVSQFHWHNKGLPVFLRGFLVQIFHLDGTLLSVPSIEAISCVRQILLLHKKVLRECSENRMQAAIRRYIECETEISSHQANTDISKSFLAVSRVLWSSILSGTPSGDPYEVLHPHHGPGATAERVRGNSKHTFTRWHQRLESVFPYSEFGIASLRNIEVTDQGVNVDFVEPEDEQPVRVIFVPKTQKTPRVIAIEPVCMQYAQQALLRFLVPLIEQGVYTGGRVNFSDQSINGKLALSSSKDSRYATIDLSEASDRVSLKHVEAMLSVAPQLRDLVMACRSSRAQLPTGEILTLKKFASMGSALCFPMEAMVFFITIVAGRLDRLRLPPTGRNIRKVCEDLYIFGDDILVPSDEASSVYNDLTANGLKVNHNKSFCTGKFRESCGVDAYDGENVTPTYSRHEFPVDRHSAEAIVAWVSTANQFYLKGYWKTTKMIRTSIEKIVGRIPFLGDSAQGLHWTAYSKVVQYNRWNKDLMRFETRTLVPTPKKDSDPLDGDSALLKCFGVIGATATIATDHLTQSVTRGKLALKSRWVAAV